MEQRVTERCTRLVTEGILWQFIVDILKFLFVYTVEERRGKVYVAVFPLPLF